MRNGAAGPVVCGIGSGAAGRRVAALAGGLANALGAPLIAVRVEAPFDRGGSQAAVLRGHARLTDTLRAAERGGGVVTRAVKLGDPATALVTVAAEMRAQLLVLGAARSARLLGGVSREVAMRASCPVAVSPRAGADRRERARQRRHILCAFDGSGEARAALSVAAAIAQQLGTAAFVAHMRPGRVDDLRAHAHAGRAALVVASSLAVASWHSGSPRSVHGEWAPLGGTPLVLVPPVNGADMAPARTAAATPSRVSAS